MIKKSKLSRQKVIKSHKKEQGKQKGVMNPQNCQRAINKMGTVSPYPSITVSNGVLPSIQSVSVSATANSVAKGSTLQFSATVTKTGNASEVVTWSVDETSATDGATISSSGLLTVPADATVEEITVTATSVFDDTKSGTKKVTVTAE